MLKKLRYALLCFYLYYFVPIHYCDSELKPYRDDIIKLTQQYCTDKQYNHPLHQYVYFKKLKGYEIGECIVKFHTYKVMIDPVFFNSVTDNVRWQLLYHEFSHCLLMQNHVDNPKNYMYPMLIVLGKETVKEQFIEDLRSKCGK
jgi:hypothetical protein